MLVSPLAANSQDLVSIDWSLVAEAIAFLILLYFLVRLLYRPLTTAMAARTERIKAGLSQAEQAQHAAEEAQHATQALLENAKTQAQEILRQASASAETMREQIVADARSEAQKVIERGQTEIARERQAVIDDLRRSVADIAIQAATQVVQRSLDSAENRRLVEESIRQSESFSAIGSS